MSSDTTAGSQFSEPPGVSASVRSESDRRSSRAQQAGAATAAIAVSLLYLVYVVHYSKNVLYLDDWSVVPLVHGSLHDHLSIGALWALHNQNRMLVPNLVYVGLATLTHDNTSVVILLSAIVFAFTFAVFLLSFRSYLGRTVTPLMVLILGAVWFSLIDWQNALWAFQFAWYLIVFFLITTIYCLQRRWFVAALTLAVLASFSSFQGLALWPVGAVMLLWQSRRWDRWMLIWGGAAVATAAGYFWHYSYKSTLPHSPGLMVKFFLIELGEVVPRANDLGLHELFGAATLVAAVFVVVQSVRHDRDALPVALITFGLLFDVSIVLGRAGYPLFVAATQSRYTMPNLIILVAITSYGCAHLERAWIFSVFALVAVQFALTTDSGLGSATAYDRMLTDNARLAVNFDRIPAKERLCDAIYGFLVYNDPKPGELPIARTDHLSEFSSGSILNYRAAGLPYTDCH
jgi:hypothetical protein